MKKNEKTAVARTCIDCGTDISHLHHNTKRCQECGQKRKQLQDQKRHKERQGQIIQWQNFIEDPESEGLTHRSAKGTKLRYWLDKICKLLNTEELEFLRTLWDWRVSEPQQTMQQRREYRTCAGIVRDWRDYYVITKHFNEVTFDAETGVIYNTDGSHLTVDFDEEKESYIIRNSEGGVICWY